MKGRVRIGPEKEEERSTRAIWSISGPSRHPFGRSVGISGEDAEGILEALGFYGSLYRPGGG